MFNVYCLLCIVYCVLFIVYCLLCIVYCLMRSVGTFGFSFEKLLCHLDCCKEEISIVAAFCRDGNPVILRTCHAGAKRSISKTRNLLYRTYVNMGGAKHLKVLP